MAFYLMTRERSGTDKGCTPGSREAPRDRMGETNADSDSILPKQQSGGALPAPHRPNNSTMICRKAARRRRGVEKQPVHHPVLAKKTRAAPLQSIRKPPCVVVLLRVVCSASFLIPAFVALREAGWFSDASNPASKRYARSSHSPPRRTSPVAPFLEKPK